MICLLTLFVSALVMVHCDGWSLEDNTADITSSYDKVYVEAASGPGQKLLSLHDMGVDLGGAQVFTFQVKASREVRLILTDYVGNPRDSLYEVTIGGWSNSMSVIWSTHGTRKIIARFRHSPLNGQKFTQFWMSWMSGLISVGEGAEVGTNSFMSQRLDTERVIRYINVGSHRRATALWKFESHVPSIGVSSDGLNFKSLSKRGYNLNSRNSISFWVKSPSDAIILLAHNHPTNSNFYWIQLGADLNTMSFIRHGGTGRYLDQAAHKPLSPEHYLPFWVSWNMGVLSVGHGLNVGSRQFMSCGDASTLEVNSVYVGSRTGVNGHWLFDADTDRHHLLLGLPAPLEALNLKD